jgi:hypothetical protein
VRSGGAAAPTRLKAERDVPLRSHVSLALSRALPNARTFDRDTQVSKTNQSPGRKKIEYIRWSRPSGDHALPSNGTFTAVPKPAEQASSNRTRLTAT